MIPLASAGIHLADERPGTHRLPCPWCDRGPRDTALAVTVEPNGGAVWLCHRCGSRGGTRTRDDRPETVRETRRALRPLPAVAAALPGWAADLWGASEPIRPGTPAGRYLVGRGCALPPEAGDLRWHPALRHPTGGKGPALVALVTDALTGAPRSLHRTWLAPDGRGKAQLEPPRLLAKGCPKAGGAIRLWPDEALTFSLLVAEGIETALSAALGFQPVWSLIDAGNLAALPVLPGVESLTIVADHDRPNPRTGRRAGPDAAEECARRWVEAGAEVRIWQAPEEGTDLNDFVMGAAA